MALKQSGRKVPNFVEDFKTLADGRFHMGLMSVPLIGVLLFTILPLIYMICLAFTNFDHNHPAPKSLFDWVGFSSFGEVLTRSYGWYFLPSFDMDLDLGSCCNSNYFLLRYCPCSLAQH